MVYTTLNKISVLSPPKAIWEKLLISLNKTHPDDEAISLVQVLNIAGLPFALGCCQLIPEFDKHWRLYAVWCARQAVWSWQYKEGPFAIAVAERFANGQATIEEFEKIQASMAPHLELSDGAPGKTAAATTHKIAGLAAKIVAASAVAAITHHAGLKARRAIRGSGDELVDFCNLNDAYDSARFRAHRSAEKAQKDKFVQLLTTLVSEFPSRIGAESSARDIPKVTHSNTPVESPPRQPYSSPSVTPDQSGWHSPFGQLYLIFFQLSPDGFKPEAIDALFLEALAVHDRSYRHSDDPDAVQVGQNEAEILSEAQRIYPRLVALYDEQVKKWGAT